VPELDRDRIALAALAVADDRGFDGFTMRAVAEKLGVTAMALYHHVDDKAALAALVVDAAIKEQPLPPPTGAWRDDLWAVANWMRRTTQAHPVVGELRRAYRVWTPAVFPMTERWLSAWQQSGLELEKAVLAATTSSMAVVGLVAEEAAFKTMDVPDGAMLASLPKARRVFTASHDYDAEFELLVRALIDGLHARLSGDAPRRRRRVSAGPTRR
jgi:AcrR family transcriptional regulator